MRFLFSLLLATAHAFSLGDIKHFLVIFFENRSFNHIFGCAAAKGLLPGVDGLKAGMGNFKDPSDPSSGFIDALEQCGKAEYVCSHSPDHSFPGTQQQIFGGACDAACAADCATRGTCPNETMGGYAYNSRTHNYSSMHAFNPEQLPMKIALAQEFALFNNFYESMPGPSQPNHMFAQSATACGATETGVVYEQCGGVLPLFPQRTIYESLLDAGRDFRIFYNGSITEGGVPGDIYMGGLLKHLAGRAHTFDAKDSGFFDSAAKGTLPEFSWLLPRNGGAHPNDDHPCHDVALGEELLKSVYEALRADPTGTTRRSSSSTTIPAASSTTSSRRSTRRRRTRRATRRTRAAPTRSPSTASARASPTCSSRRACPRAPSTATPPGRRTPPSLISRRSPRRSRTSSASPIFSRSATRGAAPSTRRSPRRRAPTRPSTCPTRRRPPSAPRRATAAARPPTRRAARSGTTRCSRTSSATRTTGTTTARWRRTTTARRRTTTAPKSPGSGENSFLVTKGFDAMKSAIARKAERVLERLADGSLPVHADEL